ncbi:hypothetical protein AB0D27_24530 [Streptomyces sp. NPDC048415]|uniref:hypothetical protein n=1 Tax=Streptomyces sp. NPDC048415 TaxID=3154822 RepID=UPI00342CC4D2
MADVKYAVRGRFAPILLNRREREYAFTPEKRVAPAALGACLGRVARAARDQERVVV